MRVKKVFLKVVCSALVALMTLSICGCRPGDVKPRDSKEEQTAAETAPTAVPAESAGTFLDDKEIRKQLASNEELRAEKTIRRADKIQLYIENTETMEGFIAATGQSEYQRCIQSTLETAYQMYEQRTVGYLGRSQEENGPGEVAWCTAEADDQFAKDVQERAFYKDNPVQKVGALSTLMQSDPDVFSGDKLSVIVSNFMNPGFDLSPLNREIKEYFDKYEQSAACVIGFTSRYEGEACIPTSGEYTVRTTFLIWPIQDGTQNFEIPCYVVLVGPESSVREYSDGLLRTMEDRDVRCTSSIYTNSVYEQIIEKPITFEVIPDQKAKKVSPLIMGSYNTGALIQHPDGEAYYTTRTNRAETMDNEEGNYTGKSSQIALISKDYDSETVYEDYEYTLYVYDPETKQWVEANKNDLAKVSVTLSTESGRMTDPGFDKQEIEILASGRRELYLSGKLLFTDDGPLSRDNIYRLEVRLKLNRPNPDAESEANPEMRAFSISADEYYSALDRISGERDGNKNLNANRGTTDLVQDALYVLKHTPDLKSFLSRLEELEGAYQDDTEVVEYVNFVFNLPEEDPKK